MWSRIYSVYANAEPHFLGRLGPFAYITLSCEEILVSPLWLSTCELAEYREFASSRERQPFLEHDTFDPV